MLHRIVRLTLVAALGLMVVACSSTAIASVVAVPSGPLVTVTTRGGECFNGPCGSTIAIERDGRVHQVAPQAADLGVLPAEALGALDGAVKTTNFDAIRERKFTGECPTAYDGQETIYEFGAPTGTERIASCETEIDPNQPVFAAVTAALRSVAAQPAS